MQNNDIAIDKINKLQKVLDGYIAIVEQDENAIVDIPYQTTVTAVFTLCKAVRTMLQIDKICMQGGAQRG